VAGANNISGERTLLTQSVLESSRARFARTSEESLVMSLSGSLWKSSPDAEDVQMPQDRSDEWELQVRVLPPKHISKGSQNTVLKWISEYTT